jgi:hypothetical protein
LTISGVDGVYSTFQNANLTKYVEFTDLADPATVKGVSGNVYKLTVGKYSDGDTFKSCLYAAKTSSPATKQPVAYLDIKEINSEDGGDSWNSVYESNVVRYTDEPYAKDILNAYGHTELAKGQTLTARLAIRANNGCFDLPLTDNEYNVRFLRPLNFTVSAANVTDAVDFGSTIDLDKLIAITDWRDIDLPLGSFLYNYYGVESIKVGTINASAQPVYVSGSSLNYQGTPVTTTLGGSEKNLYEIAPKLELTYTPGDFVTSFGTIKYFNHTANVGDFKINIPLILTYKWGYLTATLTVNVKHTTGNN